MPEVIHEHPAHIRTPEGLVYVARVIAERDGDGPWEAWLEFAPVDRHAPALRTDRETSQATRAALDVWASGLEHANLEGAFARAHLVSAR